ncbi:MAG: cold shock domain-containing protein [bacterium]|nr:cold shock domain-containing protein [bacterium]
MSQGTVKWFNSRKGFGFINVDGDKSDVFVHANEVAGTGFNRDLVENQRVEFTIEQGPKGPLAKNVKVIG